MLFTNKQFHTNISKVLFCKMMNHSYYIVFYNGNQTDHENCSISCTCCLWNVTESYLLTFTQARTNFSLARKAMSSLGHQEALFHTHTHLMAGCSGRPEIKTERTFKKLIRPFLAKKLTMIRWSTNLKETDMLRSAVGMTHVLRSVPVMGYAT